MYVHVVTIATGKKIPAIIERLHDVDYKAITKKKYFFNWKAEKTKSVFKLTAKGEQYILGLISLDYIDDEQRIEIRLLAVVEEQTGATKQIDRIAGNLIAFAAREAVKKYGAMAAISLIPKTELGQYYMDKYGFEQAGLSLYMEGRRLINLLKEYHYD